MMKILQPLKAVNNIRSGEICTLDEFFDRGGSALLQDELEDFVSNKSVGGVHDLNNQGFVLDDC